MDYTESTQKSRWTFTAEELAELRAAANVKAIERGMAALSKAACKGVEQDGSLPGHSKPPSEPLTVEQELKLLKYYHQTIKQMSKKYPLRVLACALTYLKRFYIHHSVMEFDPSKTFLTCIYMAGKTEERYIPADVLSQQVKHITQNSLLKSELAMLKGLNYDLIVHTPFLEIDGFVEDLRKLIDQPEYKDAGYSVEKLNRARQAAVGAAKCLMMSDAVVLYPPGMLALAALRSGFTDQKVKLDPYFKRVVEKCNPETGDKGSLEKLVSDLEKIDAYGVEGHAKVNDAEVKEIDRQLKEWLKCVNPPKSKSKKEGRKDGKGTSGEASEKAAKKRKTNGGG
ncbi:hypothetical protein BSKO_10375 [Bryopsis sp. KO-2023]|nr:hypothetical protein BSKO_10375 [Bryopsis sp. KO-2023]